MKIIEFDVIFLSYDEPNAELHYADLCTKVPWAKRVHGVKGSDAAHKEAAKISETDWFITVDADNIVDPAFFNIDLDMVNTKIKVYSWCGRNAINGNRYGNGGLKIWKKDFVLNMKTHEASESERAQVDFCWEDGYKNFPKIYSQSIITGSPYQAWRAGFREGVKMCLDRGRKPSVAEFQDLVHARNLDHLTIWQNVGRDVEYGEWAILGARQGTYMTMLTDWDYREVQWFDALGKIYQNAVEPLERNIDSEIRHLGEQLKTQLNLPVLYMDGETSAFFKQHYRSNWRNQGPMERE